MTSASPPPAHPAAGEVGRPWWGLGDVAAGIGASLFLSTFVGAIVFALAGWEGTDEVPVWGLALLQVPLWTGYLLVLVLAARTKGHGVVEDFGVRQRLLDEMTTAIVESVLLQPLESAVSALDEERLAALRDLFALDRD